MSLKSRLEKSINEKDVENVYRAELATIEKSSITSPFGCDGLLEAKSIRALLEFKYEEALKNKLSQCNILIQCLYYLKKFENAGEKLPSTIFVGDINECFAIHTNPIVKYLSHEIDWKIAPSEAHKKNPQLIQAMVNDIDILPFVYDVDNRFDISTIIEKITDLSANVIRKVRITKHNIVTIFDYFDKNVISKTQLSTNEKANLFIQIVINPNENYIHPKRKNILTTKSFGDIVVNQNLFHSFFSHFEGDIYSPKEKEGLTALVDRLVEDTVRRNKGEFFTPTPFVDLAHRYIADVYGEDWKERFVVWDCAWGTGNLTRDYKFKELYVSTLEQSDIDTAEQMGYNPEAVKFQYDFLNDPSEKLPQGLKDAIKSGKEILFLINPPYARSAANGTTNKVESGISDTVVGKAMKDDKWGACSANIYAQFFYRIHKVQQLNKNVKVGIFCQPNYLTGSTFSTFRKKFLSNFGFEKAFLFEARHFSDVANGWGINFAVFSQTPNNHKTSFEHSVVTFDDVYELACADNKVIYNIDDTESLSNWVKNDDKSEDFPKLSSALIIKDVKYGSGLPINCVGTLVCNSNGVNENTQSVYIVNGGISRNVGKLYIKHSNFLKIAVLFTVRRVIQSDWINWQDQYLPPNETHPNYDQFAYDSIVYSLFESKSNQSSLRQVDYKEKKWDIKNEFFWLSKNEMLELAEAHHYDELYKDAKTSDERFVHTKLFKEGIYEKLSPDAKEVLDMATELLKKSIDMRKLVSENHPEYHLDSWDAGYAQLKLVWKEYFKEEFTEFRNKYKVFEDRLRPMVYELGFLKK